MTPQLVDLNADGINDMVMATFEGTAFLVEGSSEGWKEPVHLKDVNDSNVRISMYYDMEKNEYMDVDRSTDDYENNPQHHMTSIALVDWDDDGDQDLILGAYEGALYLCLNEGSAQKPVFSATNDQVMADGTHVVFSGGLATPRIADWNGDGLFDILCGGSKGGVMYFRNTGTKGKPKFAAAESLIAKRKSPGTPDFAAGDSQEDIQAAVREFQKAKYVPTKNGQPVCPGESFHIDAVDYDGDGDLDLLVGGQSLFAQEEKKLTDEEQEELDELESKINELREGLSKIFEEKGDDAFESDEFVAMNKKVNEAHLRREALNPSPRPASYVWVYRNMETEKEDETHAAKMPEFEKDKFGVKASFSPSTAKPGDEVTMTIHVHIPEGFHIYGRNNVLTPTEITYSDMGGLSPIEKLVVPGGEIVIDAGKPSYWLQDTVVVTQKMTAPDSSGTATIKGQVAYTMCDKHACRPPATETFEATLILDK